MLLALLTILPGADMALVAKVALVEGRPAAFRTTLGISAGAPAAPAPGRAGALRGPFLQGFLSNVFNPKVALFYLTFVPQFIGPHDDVFLRSEAFALSHAAMGLVWLTLYAWAIDRIGALFARSGARRWLERTTGALLVALGARLALERR